MMDGKGGCCIAPYVAGIYDMSKVDRIMLRFRPIVPKPTTGGPVSGASATENGDSYLRTRRRKRRYVRDGNNSQRLNNRKNKVFSEETDPSGKTSTGGSLSPAETVVTLSLIPEAPDRKESPARGSSSSEHSDVGVSVMKQSSAQNLPVWFSFDDGNVVTNSQVSYGIGHVGSGPDRTAVAQSVLLVGSYVTVECLTETWVAGFGLGNTDEERMMCLDKDTCPGFISDCLNRVKWANRAYRELLGQGQQDGLQPFMVWLGMKEGVVLPVMSQAFTCRVRVTCWKEKSSLTLPCDVWRMDGGGFAWRLDVKAALSLGR